ncbi:MAG: hypothetical protein ABFS17_12065 [Chloroflexota bacterium]
MKKIIGLISVLLVLTLACINTPNNGGLTSEEIVATSSSATLTAMAGGQVPEENTPDPGVTQPPAPNCQPLHPGAQVLSLPVGVGIAETANPDVVSFLDFQGNLIGTKNLTDLAWVDTNQVHLAGGNTAGFPNLPIVYHSLISGGEKLRLNVNNAISNLADVPQMVIVTGAEGQQFITYTLNSSGASGWISYLYGTNYASAGTASALMARDEGDGYVIYPLGVKFSGGAAQGIWYTASMYGIGNINFEPFKGLFYFNLLDSTVTTYLSADTVIAGFSPDQTWVAYKAGAGNNPSQATGSITLKNLITCQEVVLTFDQPTNLGGWVAFSPDNQYVAWLETFGPSPMEATWRVRVAKIDGTSLVNAELSSLSSLLGGVQPSYVLPPMKWVDNHVLGLSLRPVSGPDSIFVIWAPDPAMPLDPVLGANQSAGLGNGELLGLLYP